MKIRLLIIFLMAILIFYSNYSVANQNKNQDQNSRQQPLTEKDLTEPTPSGSPPVNNDTPLVVTNRGSVLYNGKNVHLDKVYKQDAGIFLPDGKGGLIWESSQKPRPELDPRYVDARELKLQVRELADQLISGITDPALCGTIALPTSFVSQDNFDISSSFGRYIAEQMYYEFNQRGYPVREYRIDNSIKMREDGDFFLSKSKKSFKPGKISVILIGTYYFDQNNIFINARLIKPDGLVMRTANLVTPINPVTKRMLAKSGRSIQQGILGIKDFTTAKDKTANLSVLDMGYDIH